MQVIKIVRQHLLDNEFTGLMTLEGSCGCEIDDLVPCNSDFSQCVPGHKHADPRPEEPDGWAIWEQKKPPTAEQWANVNY